MQLWKQRLEICNAKLNNAGNNLLNQLQECNRVKGR